MAGEARDARDEDEGTNIDVDDEPDDDAADGEPQTLEEWKAAAEKARSELATKEQALRKANRERARLGRQAKPPVTAKPVTGGDKPAPEITPEKLVELEQAIKDSKRWRSSTIQEKAKLRLTAEGVDAKRVARVVRLIDEEDLDVDDDGNLTGIDDQIEDLKAEWPEFFAKPKVEEPEEEPRPKRPVRDRRANRDAGDKAAAGSPQKSIAEQRAERVLGLTAR